MPTGVAPASQRFAGVRILLCHGMMIGVIGWTRTTYSAFTVRELGDFAFDHTEMVLRVGLEPTRPRALRSKLSAAANYAIGAIWRCGRDLPPRYQRLKGAAFVYLHPHQNLAMREGLEPSTTR